MSILLLCIFCCVCADDPLAYVGITWSALILTHHTWTKRRWIVERFPFPGEFYSSLLKNVMIDWCAPFPWNMTKPSTKLELTNAGSPRHLTRKRSVGSSALSLIKIESKKRHQGRRAKASPCMVGAEGDRYHSGEPCMQKSLRVVLRVPRSHGDQKCIMMHRPFKIWPHRVTPCALVPLPTTSR